MSAASDRKGFALTMLANWVRLLLYPNGGPVFVLLKYPSYFSWVFFFYCVLFALWNMSLYIVCWVQDLSFPSSMPATNPVQGFFYSTMGTINCLEVTLWIVHGFHTNMMYGMFSWDAVLERKETNENKTKMTPILMEILLLQLDWPKVCFQYE